MRLLTCFIPAAILLAIPATAEAKDGCSLERAKEIRDGARAYVALYRNVLPPVAPEDDELFARASMVIPPTPAVAQLKATFGYKTWIAWRTTNFIESALVLADAGDETKSVRSVVARIAYLGLQVEESRREFLSWSRLNGVQMPTADRQYDLQLEYESLETDYSLFFVECISDKPEVGATP